MGSCYRLYHPANKWDEAKLSCLDFNSKLVDITSKQENDFLAQFMKRQSTPSAWIGLSDSDVEGHFLWTNGVPANFTNWGGQEPNGGETENCVRLNMLNSSWIDVKCLKHYRYLCEKRGWFRFLLDILPIFCLVQNIF